MAIDGTELRERPWQPGIDDERFNRAPRNPNFTGGPSPQAQAYERELQTRGMSATERTKWTRADAKAFGGMPPGAKPTIGLRASNAVGDAADAVRNGADAVRNGAAGARAEVLKRQAERAAAAAGPQPGRVARAWGTTKKVGKAGGALATVASGFGDYRIDDPEVDSSAAGTLRALGDGDFAGAGRSLSKGALETLMDFGSSATGLVDGVTSFAPKAWQTDLSGRYNRALREQFGDQLIGPDTIAAEDSTAQGFAPQGGAAPPQGGAAPPTNPHAEADQAKLNAFALAEKQRAESEQLRQMGESFEARPGSNMARPDLGYGPIADRTQLTNARAAEMNPAGVIKVTKGANGNPEFSGMDLRGQASYANADGKALPGGGWDGKGFSNFSVAPAGSNVVLGPNGSYAYATSGSGTRPAEQLQQDIANSKQQVAAQAQRLGVDVAGLSPAQALKYMGEVENARSINAADAAAAAAYDRSGKWMNDLRDPRTLALRNASVGPTIFRNRREQDIATKKQQKKYDDTWNLVAGAPDREANRELEYTKSANTLRGQQMSAEAQMYGSDNTLRGNIYQSDATAATARKTAAHTQAKDYTAAQKTAREEAVNMFRREGDKDAGAAEQRVNVADQILPGFSTMDTASKARARPTVDSAVDLFDRMKSQTPQGMWEKLTSSDKPGLTGLPLIQGWKVERSFGGDHYITNPKTKQTITIGSGLNDMQLKMLENATQTGSFLSQNK